MEKNASRHPAEAARRETVVPTASGRATGASWRNLRTFESFKVPAYRLYFATMVGWMASMNMEQMTRSLLIYRLTGSASTLGMMALASALPMLFLSLFGGVIADRMPKKNIISIGVAGMAIVTLGIAFALTLGYISTERPNSWWILFAASVLIGTIMAISIPSRQAILPEIVGREQLLNAVSLSTLEMNALRLLAPAASGLLIDAFGFAAVYYLMAALYSVAAVLAFFLPAQKIVTAGSRAVGGVKNTLIDIKEGLRYVRHEPNLFLVLGFTIFVVVLSMPYMTLLPIFTEDILKVGAKGMGVLLSISGIGAVASSLILASLPNRKRGLLFMVSCLFLGVALVAFSASQAWYLSLAMIIVVGFGQTGRMALSNALIQYYTEDAYRGRVVSILMMEWGLTSFGSFGAALLAETVGVQWAVGGFALVLIFLTILAFIFVPRFRRLE